MQFHKIKPGNPNSKLLINFVVKDINMKGSLRLDKNKPSNFANLGSDEYGMTFLTTLVLSDKRGRQLRI